MNKIEPDGMLNLKNSASNQASFCIAIDRDGFNHAMDLMQEMAEALEKMKNHPYEGFDYLGREALRKFMEWK